MRGKLRKLLSLCLAVVLTVGMMYLPTSADTVKAAGDEPEFNVRFTNLQGEEIETAQPGDTILAVVSASNAENMTGFRFRLYYDETYLTTRGGAYTQNINSYADSVTDQYDEFGIPTNIGTADGPQAGLNWDLDGYVNAVWAVVNKDPTDTITTEGMGDIDLFRMNITVSEDAEGEIPFSVQRLEYALHGSANVNVVEEAPVVKNTLTVEREPVPMTGFTLNEGNLSLDLSSDNPTAQLEVTSYEPEDTTDKNNEITWSSEDDSVATVDQNGLVTATGKGKTTITATITNSEGKAISQSCEVDVTKSVQSIELNATSITLANGQTRQLEATVQPSDADNSEISWESSDSRVATVDDNGLVTAVGENGTATITASTANGTEATCTVTVQTSHLEEITLNESKTEIASGATQDLNVTFTPNLANVTDTVSDVTWESLNPDVATVEADEDSDHSSAATVTAVASGTTTITAKVTTSNGDELTAKCEVSVYTPVQSISVMPSQIPAVGSADQFLKGEKETVQVQLNPTNADRYNLEWTVDTEGVVSLEPSEKGRICTITAKAAGTAIVTVTDTVSGKRATVSVTVTELPITTVNVSANTKELNKGETVKASAEVLPANTTDENKSVKWSSSNDAVATVDADGIITAVGAGSATITATSNARPEVSGSIDITVNVPLDSISFAEGAQNELLKGQSTTLEVVYNPTDTTVDRTVTWDVSGDTDAVELTDNRNGTATVTALKEGEVQITAKVAGMTVEQTITVEEIHLTGIALDIAGSKTVDLKDGAFDVNIIQTPDNTTDKIVSATWESTNEAVASVSGNTESATITPVDKGTTTIKVKVVTDSGVTLNAECEITVEIPMESVLITRDGNDITGTTFTLRKGDTAELSYLPDPENTSDEIDHVEWTSSVPESVRVEADADGNATITTLQENEETVRITATAVLESGESISSYVNVTAEEIHIESISLNESSINLEAKISETKQLTVTYNPQETTDAKAVTWSSSNPSVATVDENGLVTAVSGGTAVITARTANGKTASCDVKVPIHITSVVAEDIEMMRGDEPKAIEAVVNPENTDDDKTLSYEIAPDSEESVIALDGNMVTPLKAGTAKVIVTAEGAYDDISTTVTVTVKEINLDDVSVSASGQPDEDGVYQIRIDEENPQIDVSWAADVTDDVEIEYTVVSGDDVVSVDEAGNLTFLKEGNATIRIRALATDGAGNTREIYKECSIYVDVIELEGIEFAEDSKDVTIEEGAEKTLTVIYTPEDTTDRVLTWTSSDPSIATVTPGEDGTAVVKGVKAGEVTITATSADGLEAATTVTVMPKSTTKPEDPSGTTDNPGGTGNGGSGDSQTSDQNKDNGKAEQTKAAVQTGDTANPWGYGVAITLSLAVILLVLKRRFKNV